MSRPQLTEADEDFISGCRADYQQWVRDMQEATDFSWVPIVGQRVRTKLGLPVRPGERPLKSARLGRIMSVEHKYNCWGFSPYYIVVGTDTGGAEIGGSATYWEPVK